MEREGRDILFTLLRTTTVKPIRPIAIALLGLLVLQTASAQKRGSVFPTTGRGVEHAIDSILSGMTLPEKIGQLVQYTGGWSTGPTGQQTINLEQRNIIRSGGAGSFLNVTGAAETHELQRIAVEESRARIPLIFGLDVIHGFKTTFPIPLAEAASWDPAAVELSARIGAREAASSGIQWTFAPMVDIARDPRWGRIAEGSGEDTYLGSVMAAARVRGFQGTRLDDPSSIVACVKHYAAYGAAEGGRDYNTVDMSEQTLRDVYLPPFKAALDAGAGTFMASFNEINGVPSSGSRFLLTTVLRDEWKFNGFVVSDWGSIGELIPHGYAANPGHAAELALNAGLDMDMESRAYRDSLASLITQKRVTVATVDESVRRILRIKFRLGLFNDPYHGCTPANETATLRHPSHIAAARSVARSSIVLLKNQNNLLPLSARTGAIAVIGPLAQNHRDPVGTWAGPTDTNNVVTVLDGIQETAPGAMIMYAPGCSIDGADTAGFSAALAIARKADVVVMAMGEAETMSGEASCRSSLGLPGKQLELLKAVQATGKPVVLVLMNGRPLALPWEAEHVPAIVETWFLGHETGHAIADVLFGAYAPTGRLPASFPRTTGQVPVYYAHKNTGRPSNDTVHYTSRYLDVVSTPLYPFGYGLTYTTFGYSDLALTGAKLRVTDSLKVRVTVKNTGARAGDEVVQMYVRDDVGSLTRPVRELKAYRRIHLAAGEATTVTLSIPVTDLAFTGGDMKRRVEPGTFTVFVGPHAAQGLEGQFEVMAQ
jgi:beta-glucosidase